MIALSSRVLDTARLGLMLRNSHARLPRTTTKALLATRERSCRSPLSMNPPTTCAWPLFDLRAWASGQ
jgi:hypothetical protein